MGLFSSSSSSKTEYNTSQNSGFSEIGGPVNSVNAAGGSRVNMFVSDRGSIREAFDLGESAIDSNRATTNRAFDSAERLSGKALDFGETTLDQAFTFARSASQQSQEAVQDNVQAFTNKFSEFANRQSASSDQRVMDVAKWGIAAMVGLAAWNSYNRRKGAA